MKIVLTVEFANEVLKYLQTKPYVEVFQLIHGFQVADKLAPEPVEAPKVVE
jgi:hypothetical protein